MLLLLLVLLVVFGILRIFGCGVFRLIRILLGSAALGGLEVVLADASAPWSAALNFGLGTLSK